MVARDSHARQARFDVRAGSPLHYARAWHRRACTSTPRDEPGRPTRSMEGGLACRHARSPVGQQCEPTTANQPPEHTASPSTRADDCRLTTASR
eukprot:7008184-Prymnesium_polylepis.1